MIFGWRKGGGEGERKGKRKEREREWGRERWGGGGWRAIDTNKLTRMNAMLTPHISD